MLQEFNLAECIITCDGVPVHGFNDGDAVSVEFESDITSDEAGSDGEVTRSVLNDRRATITFNLKSTSSFNSFLRAKANLTRTAGDGDKFSFFLEDPASGEIVESRQTWVQTDPGSSVGREATDREWTCRGSKVTITNS